MIRPLPGLLLCLLPLAPGALAAPSNPLVVAPDDVERAEAWPEPEDKGALADALNNLRKSKSDAHVTEWSDALAEMGPAAAPRLLSALAREKSEEKRARMVGVLERITAAEHTRLLGAEFGSKSIDVRLFALRRVAELGDAGLVKQAEEVWETASAAAEARAKKKKRKKGKEADPREAEELQRAALLALSCGSASSLEHLVDLAGSKEWKTWRASLVAAARAGGAARPDVAEAIVPFLDPKGKGPVRAGALRLLAQAGQEKHKDVIAPLLDARENHVKIAAINALRRLVDGAPPLEKLSTFDAIEKAKAWKDRI